MTDTDSIIEDAAKAITADVEGTADDLKGLSEAVTKFASSIRSGTNEGIYSARRTLTLALVGLRVSDAAARVLDYERTVGAVYHPGQY